MFSTERRFTLADDKNNNPEKKSGILKMLIPILILAVLGFIAGTKWRKAKDNKTAKMTQETMEENKQ